MTAVGFRKSYPDRLLSDWATFSAPINLWTHDKSGCASKCAADLSVVEEIMTTQSTCLPTTVARSRSIRRLVDAIYLWNFCRMMKVSLQPCCLSFKDFIQRLSDKQTEEHLLPRITSIRLIFFPSFSSLYWDSHWFCFFLLTSFQKRNRIIITAARLCLKTQNKPSFTQNDCLAEQVYYAVTLSDCTYLIVSVNCFLHVHTCVL